MRVLDAGCGTGDDVRAIAEIVGAGGRVTGVDSSRTMIDEAQTRGVPPNAAFLAVGRCRPRCRLGTALSTPCAPSAYFSISPRRSRRRTNWRRVLAPGGTALLLDQDWESLVIAGGARDVTRRVVRAFVDHLANGWAARESRGMLLRAGFASATSIPAISQPPLPLAFDTILKPAMEAAMRDGSIDTQAAQTWLQSLLEADLRGEFFCTVLVVITVGTAPRGA